jgi:CRISPR-associated endonuclease Csn1
VWLTRLNNLRIVVDGVTRPINEQERQIALPLPYLRAGDLKHEHLRTALVKAGVLDNSFRFAKFPYAQSADGKSKDPESAVLVKLPAWQELRKLLKDKGLETEWQGMAGAAQAGDPELLDRIAWVLSVYKDDVEVEHELGKLNLPGGNAMVEALGEARFDKFSNLSLKALRKIVPHMETGLRYDEACEAAGYHHSQLFKAGEGEERYLPPFYEQHRGKTPTDRNKMLYSARVDGDIAGGIPRNPVVLRALNQARKVMNALIREYGSPASVHIEMARDLSRPMDERNKIKKAQDEYRDQNDKVKAAFAAEYGMPAKSREFEKFLLYREQQGKCAYSLEPFDLHRVLHDIGYAEVDHALPRSRSFDNSKNNKVLVLAHENRNKGNATPYEYLDGANDSERWRRFVVWVESNKAYRLAKRTRLLRKNFGAEEAEGFRERNLYDTRYICKFFKNYIERYLKLADESESKRCVVLSGQLTAFLRARWQLTKIRSDSDRHHALDAAVVAACSHGMVKRLSDYSRRKELQAVRDGFVDLETGEIVDRAMHQQLKAHFPDPWPEFRHELEARLYTDDPAQLRAGIERLGTHSPEALGALKPLFVSRAPQRRNGGAAHMDTIYTKPRKGHVLMVKDKKAKKPEGADSEEIRRTATMDEKLGMAIGRIGVMDKDSKGNYKLTLEKLDDIVDPHRNKRMAEALQQWIASRDEREKEAKSIEASLGRGKERRKPTDTENAKLELLRAFPRKPLRDDPESGPFTGPVIRTVKVNAGNMSGIQVRNGLVAQESLIRVDVYVKDTKFYLVPLYIADTVRRKQPHQTADGETQIDDSFDFRFSLHPNDLAKVTLKGKGSILGYFRGYGGPPNPYNITLALHDRAKNGHERANEKGEIPSIGIKTALSVEKFHVDVLGNVYPAPPEKRRDLA